MRHSRTIWLAAAPAALALMLLIAPSAGAQGFPSGGDAPRRGGPRGAGPVGGPPAGASRDPGAEVARRFEQMASLKAALRHVDDLTDAQKDSLERIEDVVREELQDYGKAARSIVEAATARNAPPDTALMRGITDGARKVRDRELAAARTVLATDAQRAAFDANVATLREEEAKREEEMRARRARWP